MLTDSTILLGKTVDSIVQVITSQKAAWAAESASDTE